MPIAIGRPPTGKEGGTPKLIFSSLDLSKNLKKEENPIEMLLKIIVSN